MIDVSDRPAIYTFNRNAVSDAFNALKPRGTTVSALKSHVEGWVEVSPGLPDVKCYCVLGFGHGSFLSGWSDPDEVRMKSG